MAQLALTSRSCTLCTDITCQVRLHQWLQRSEVKMPCNVSRNKYQLHRMQPVTVTSTVASNVCHTHHNSVSMNDAPMRKPNMNRLYSLIIKPTRCTNYSKLLLERNSTCFGQFLCPTSGVFHCTHSNGICHTGLLAACEQNQDGTASWVPKLSIPLTNGVCVDVLENGM